MAAMIGTGVVFLLAVLISVCSAGEYCTTYYAYSSYSNYCVYGCCGYSNQDCCSGPVGLIIGLCVGGAVFLFFIILTICICRRRRYGGFIYGSRPQGAVVVQQSTMTSQNGVVTTAGVQPGVTYPPYPQYQYQYPAGAYPASAPPYPGAVPAPMGYPPMQPGAGYPPQPAPQAHEPPKYDSLNFESDRGIHNKGFDTVN